MNRTPSFRSIPFYEWCEILPRIENAMRALPGLMRIAITGRLTGNLRKYKVDSIHLNRLALAASKNKWREMWADNLFPTLFDRKAGYFIDVGANLGQTLLKKLEFSPDRGYLGIEPQLGACNLIQGFLKKNELHDHYVLPIALSDETKILTLGTRRANDESASIISEFRPSGFHIRRDYVPVFTGDHVVSDMGIGDISVLKIDVEGAELEVLRGFRGTIERNSPFLVFEVLPNRLLATGERISEEVVAVRQQRNQMIYAYLSELHYKIFRIEEGYSWSLLEEISADSDHSYYCVAEKA